MLETKFKEKVLKDLKTLPLCWFIKTMERGRCGTPDILACVKGQFIAIELKREGKHVTPLQAHTLNKIADAGGYAFESTPSTWASDFSLLRDVL